LGGLEKQKRTAAYYFVRRMEMGQMKIAVLSDVHGNMPALEAVISAIEDQEIESIIVAGDLIGGPNPNETIELLQSLGCILIVGNMDLNLLKLARGKGPKEWYSFKQYGDLRWTNEHIKPEVLDFLESLPEQQVIPIKKDMSIRVVHGSPRSPYEAIFPDRDPDVLNAVIQEMQEQVLVCGHIHVPWKKTIEGKLIFNPGAVSAPLNGHAGAHYAILDFVDDEWKVDHKTASYDTAIIKRAYIESGLLEAGSGYARVFLRACETGLNYYEMFMGHAHLIAKEAGYQDIEYFPDDVWEQAVDTFPWEQSG
jgi:putative phosphoesterase